MGILDPKDLPLVAGGVCNSTIYKENDPDELDNGEETSLLKNKSNKTPKEGRDPALDTYIKFFSAPY